MEKVMNLDDVAYELHQTATEKGFWDKCGDGDFIFYAKQLCMIHSEVTEAMEAIRKDQGDEKFVEELADIIIRVLDLYAGISDRTIGGLPSLQEVLEHKANINKDRPRLHGVRG